MLLAGPKIVCTHELMYDLLAEDEACNTHLLSTKMSVYKHSFNGEQTQAVNAEFCF